MPEIETLKRRDDFRRIFRKGSRAEEGALSLRYVAAGMPAARFGFQIKKKPVRPSPGTA